MTDVKTYNFLVLAAVCFVSVVLYAKNVETAQLKRTTNNNSCENVRQFLQYRNITEPSRDTKGEICRGECCSDETEELLRRQGQKDFATLLKHNSRTLQGLLSFTAASLQNHVSDLSRQSENKTLLLFSQVYKSMATSSRNHIAKLYTDIRNYIVINSTRTDLSLSSTSNIDIKTTVANFFADFFPLVYHNILHINASLDFAADYKACLTKTAENILPFGDIPNLVSQSLAKSLETMRLLLQAFDIGTEVLNATDRLLVDESGKSNGECHIALLRMSHCPKCLGLGRHTKPCGGYCLNVLRGCLTRYVAELDLPWNGYVEGIESLINVMKRKEDSGANAEVAIRSLDTKISEALLKAIQNSKEIDAKVQRICGRPTFTKRNDVFTVDPTAAPVNSKIRSSSNFDLGHCATSISKSRGFYGNLADTICKDETFAEQKDQKCWNGDKIGEYTKVIVDVSLDMQKYNPEVKPMTNPQNVDPRVGTLVEKLRLVHHMAMSSIGTSGSEVDYMQRDGFEGSGSGNGPDDENEDDLNPTGSGSGTGAIPEHEGKAKTHHFDEKGRNNDYGNTPSAPEAASASVHVAQAMLICLAVIVLRL